MIPGVLWGVADVLWVLFAQHLTPTGHTSKVSHFEGTVADDLDWCTICHQVEASVAELPGGRMDPVTQAISKQTICLGLTGAGALASKAW